jgi:hypothetical protein
MKKNFKKLTLHKSTLSNLESNSINGGQDLETVIAAKCLASNGDLCTSGDKTRCCNQSTGVVILTVNNCVKTKGC